MSNEQSPPPRKVIPYKKGKRRRSPFADVAFQFSGTALDVAIQQRQEEIVSPPALPDTHISTDEPETDALLLQSNSPNQIEEASFAPENTKKISQGIPTVVTPSIPSGTSPDSADLSLVNLKNTLRKSSPTTNRQSPPSTPSDLSFQAFVERWKHGLHRGQLKMCEVLFNKTHAIGQTDCETSFSVLMQESGLSRRQSFQVISELEKMGFVERLTLPKHSTKKGTGSHLRFYISPKL